MLEVKPGQVYKSIESLYRQNVVRTLRVDHVGKPHPIYPGRLNPDLTYAFCISRREVPGSKTRNVAIEVSRLLSKKFKLVEQPGSHLGESTCGC